MTGDFSLWVYLARTPLLWLTVTLTAYVAADRIAVATGRHPLANPVLFSVVFVAAVLAISDTPYPTYFEGAQFVHFLLGPATVVLAFPLYERRATVMRALLPMLAALAAGAAMTLLVVIVLARLFSLPQPLVVSLAPKSVTSGVAMGIAETLGGDPTLTAILVILTGIIGAILVTPMMERLGITDMRARGFAAGLAAHGIGTARAFQVSEVAGTFAGIAMGLNAFLTAILAPVALHLLR
ncbi:LrgB family protein [Methylobacterium aerolatum]|uniref:Murein hydrolase (TIGR00659 family) n=1 Tax=Methylobacterium aerolatum TaxID=418708 RepID=A0ABU0I1T1_9HYPH|nr:LrgB family protein [Methylobacterium aerolatum]MDQ0447671.1 putative murein hydrolase (TIGR00659 family) [Methylobacterium aerolatum]GJD34771.1 Inner membrane protein YohK [Methylobacterium aerolatum]